MTGLSILYTVGLSNFFSAFNTLSYAHVYASTYFLGYVISDDFSEILFGLTISPSSGVTCTGILSSGYDLGMMSSSIPGTKSSLFSSRNIFRVSAVSVIFKSAHLTS